VKESGGGNCFLRKVEEGAARQELRNRGRQTGRLPADVVNRAREVLAEHESAERSAVKHLAHDEARQSGPMQLTIFTPLSEDRGPHQGNRPGRISPMDALHLLHELKKQME